jgi:uncharacterized protein
VAIVVGIIVILSLGTFWLTVHPPRLVLGGTPRAFGLPAEAVTITADDGVRLAAWLIPRRGVRAGPAGPATGPAVILLHGYPAEKSDLLPLAAALHSSFTTLLVDLRFFGASEGRVTTLGHRERRDLQRAVDLLEGRGVTRVGVFGYSLGGAVGLLAGAEDPRIRAVAAYAPFADLRTLGRELYGAFWLLRYPLVDLMRLWSRLFLGADITRPSPAMAAATLAIPVLLVHSRGDEQIPFTHAERLAEALDGNPAARFHFPARGRHNDPIPGFEQRLERFFLEHLGDGTPAGEGG